MFIVEFGKFENGIALKTVVAPTTTTTPTTT